MAGENKIAAADAPQAAASKEGGAEVYVAVVKNGIEIAHIVASPRRVYEMSVDGVDADLYIDNRRVELGVWIGYRLKIDVVFDRRETSVYFDSWENGLRYYRGIKDGGEIKTPDGVVIRVTWL